ncbi:MAG: hypothetical protein ACTSV7_04540 [Candidatus Baldrarchaeia archaeon]
MAKKKKTFTIKEVKDIVRRATECTVFIPEEACEGLAVPRYSVCPHCAKETFINDVSYHYDNCLVHLLEDIVDAEIVIE